MGSRREQSLSRAARCAVAAVYHHRVFPGSFGGQRPPLQFLLMLVVGVALRAAPAPAIFQSAPGRSEIAALDAAAAERVAARAEEGWRTLMAPLGLPERFSTPI